MLARIGNSLFWLGRYIERAEHVARFTKVQYASSMDAPLVQSKEYILESILNMAGVRQAYFGKYADLTEDEVLHFVTIEESNLFSIQAFIGLLRENARGARDCISSELWETINRFYHETNNYTPDKLRNEGIHRFSKKVEENSAVIKGYVDNTLLRNEIWMLITLGIHLERAIQVALIILNKVYDIGKLEPSLLGGPVESFQWTILLRSAESFDMFKRYHLINPNRHNSLDFLIFNHAFPKALTYNLERVQQLIHDIAFHEQKGKGSIDFMAGKIASQFQFLTIEEVDGSIQDFLNNTINSLYGLANLLNQKYLHY
jgi:uncharacterized alpha-E superfamily protein